MTATEPWLAPALDYIGEWLGYQMRVTEQPGVLLAVAHAGEVVLELALGAADLTSGEALTPRHRFRVASHSKSFTAAGIMKLREAGRLSLDHRAGDFVPGLHPEIARATIAQLLSHAAGIQRDGPSPDYWADRKPFLDEAALRADLAEPPAIEAALRLKYSNHGFGLAGLIIEAVTGEPYRAWIEREVVAAAGLTQTTADGPPATGAPFARGHSGKALLGRRLAFPGDQPTHALAAATGFISTAADLTRFFSQLSPRAEASFLTPESRREMTRPQWTDPWSAAPQRYGLGTISASIDGWEVFGHSGGFLGYVSRTLVAPERRLAVSCLTNSLDGMAHGWAEGALGILKRFAEGGAPEPGLADWRGRWWSAWGPNDLVPVGDKVIVATPGAPSPLQKATELSLEGPDRARISEAGGFAAFGERAELVRGPDGTVEAVKLGGSRLLKEADIAAELTARYEAGAGAS